MTSDEKVTVKRDDAQAIVDWWRNANEAPGGCSALDAIRGMREAVMGLHVALSGEAESSE